MNIEQEKAFNEWWNSYSKTKIDDEAKNLAMQAWIAAINYQKNKANREFRWDGVIR